MCTRNRILLLLAAALAIVTNTTLGQALSGTKTIGPTGNYTAIGAAILDIQTQGLSGPLILELQSTYVSTVETFPLVFSGLPTSATNTLTLRPTTGATGLSIVGAAYPTIVALDGVDYFTIDGRPGGTGTSRELAIENSAAGNAMRFLNDACYNRLMYLILRATGGAPIVGFSTTTGTTGNDNNCIDFCDLRDGLSYPSTGIESYGSTGTPAQYNSNDTISNCSIFNFRQHMFNGGAGVVLWSGNSDWIITGNSVYQTAPILSGASGYGLWYQGIRISGGSNHVISGNYIGGSAPQAGGAPWAITASPAITFVGISLSTDAAASIQNNTISNLSWNTSSSGIWGGISLQGGGTSTMTVMGNTIGSPTGTGSVLVTSSSQATSYGIAINAAAGATANVTNNIIGAITLMGSSTSVSHSFRGIENTGGGIVNITNNTIGSTATANSINLITSSTSTTGQRFVGINNTSTGPTLTISSNVIANINNNYVGTNSAGQVIGILTSGGGCTIADNTVRSMSTTSKNSNSFASSSVIGISLTSTNVGQTVSLNRIYGLTNTTSSSGVGNIGLFYNGPTSGTNTVTRNIVHSLCLSTPITSSFIFGIHAFGGTANYQNNIIRLGFDAAGNSITTGYSIYGITEMGSGGTVNNNYYFNSIHIGGTEVLAGGSSTFGLSSVGSPGSCQVRNNIILNDRSNASGSAVNHYAFLRESITGDYNFYRAGGNGGALTTMNGSPISTLPAYQTLTGQELNSGYGDPAFTSTTDLHIDPANANSWNVNGRGIAVASVANDYDGDVRSAIVGTPTDIGADEFTPSAAPPNATSSGAPAAGTTTTYTSGGRVVAEIVWPATLLAPMDFPTDVVVRYYPGVPPPGTVNSNINSYWDITATGGSGYTCDVVLHYSPAELNNIPELNLYMGKTDATNAWRLVEPSIPNEVANTVTGLGVTGFSKFTLTNQNNALPVQLASFTAVELAGRGVLLRWRTLSETNNYGFFVQRKNNGLLDGWMDVPNGFVAGHGTTLEPHDYEFRDSTVSIGRWSYRLRQVDIDGTEHFSDAIDVRVLTAVRESAPLVYSLAQNYPNPFNPSTTIKFSVERTGRAVIELYNILGQRVMTLFDEVAEAGQYYTVLFDAKALASGAYIYRIQSGSYAAVKKMLILR
ncbi:MAG: T9SS type A sorting domain-containing protein [Ignavibacteriae bacterium]|nr:T9SS type A sorting domain-containing protein [Ignavibacteriota bacterium]